MTKEEFQHHFGNCFKDKKDSRLDQYLGILRHPTALKIHNPREKTRWDIEKEEKEIIQKRGYEKWKVIPLKFFQINDIPIEISDDYERNILFLTPIDYFMASYILMLYFSTSDQQILCKFFKDRLRNILKRKKHIPEIPKAVKDMIHYKITKGIDLTKEDKETISDIFTGHYSGRHKTRNPKRTNPK